MQGDGIGALLTWDTALFAQTSVSLANATVVACVTAASPVLSLNATRNCSTGRRDAGTATSSAMSSQGSAFRPGELLTDSGPHGVSQRKRFWHKPS